MGREGTKSIAVNRKARHDYFVEDSFEAGIELMCRPMTHSSPFLTTQYESFRLAAPWRSDLTSVPTSSMPASKLSSTK